MAQAERHRILLFYSIMSRELQVIPTRFEYLRKIRTKACAEGIARQPIPEELRTDDVEDQAYSTWLHLQSEQARTAFFEQISANYAEINRTFMKQSDMDPFRDTFDHQSVLTEYPSFKVSLFLCILKKMHHPLRFTQGQHNDQETHRGLLIKSPIYFAAECI